MSQNSRSYALKRSRLLLYSILLYDAFLSLFLFTMIKCQNIKFLMFPTLKYKNKLSLCSPGSNLSLVITASNQQIHLETTPIEEQSALTHKLKEPVFIRVISELNERKVHNK